MMMKFTCGILLTLLLTVAPVTTTSAEDSIDFVRDVRPIFQKHCYSCHAKKQQKSGLRLDIKSEAFKGGDVFGPSIIPRDVEESPLIQFVSDPNVDLPMPPEGDRLSAEAIAILTKWVAEGTTECKAGQLVSQRN